MLESVYAPPRISLAGRRRGRGGAAARTGAAARASAARAPRPAAGGRTALAYAYSPDGDPAADGGTTTPTHTPTPTPAPAIQVGASASPPTITLRLDGQVPASAAEALLWYDTAAGHAIRRVPLGDARSISASVTITPTEEGLTRTGELADTLDYWWAVRDRAGAITRRSDTVVLPPALEALAQTEPITAPAELSWSTRATPHFLIHAPPQSAAERDLEPLATIAEASYTQAATVISPTTPVSISVYLLPRVFWQGGVAYGDDGPLIISYPDRDYIGVEMWAYFVHEVAHALADTIVPPDGEVGGLLGEGVAVYATGGHYDLEPIDEWAAALAASDRYMPLCELRYDFYSAQHEVAYQEAASFTAYLIRTYGLETFTRLLAAQRPERGGHHAHVDEFCADDDQRIAQPIGKTNGELEREWLAYLETLTPTDRQRRAWELTVRFFDTMRGYQETLDQPARVLPPPPEEWDRATAAGFLNAARGRRAAVLETMLGAAGHAISRDDVEHGAALLDEIEHSLGAGGVPAGPLTRDYDAITSLVEVHARALRLGDTAALDQTIGTPSLADRLPFQAAALLHDLRYMLVELDVRGATANGVVRVDGASLDGRQIKLKLYRVRFDRRDDGWKITTWADHTPLLMPPPQQGLHF